MRLGARMAHSLNKLKTISPANRLTAKPIGPACSRPPQRALKTWEKTKVYTASIAKGVMKLHVIPRTEPLYLPRTSRSVSLHQSSLLSKNFTGNRSLLPINSDLVRIVAGHQARYRSDLIIFSTFLFSCHSPKNSSISRSFRF